MIEENLPGPCTRCETPASTCHDRFVRNEPPCCDQCDHAPAPLGRCMSCALPMGACDSEDVCCTDCDHLPATWPDAVHDLMARLIEQTEETTRARQLHRQVVPLDPEQALTIIATHACEHDTRGAGQCLRDGRSPLARYGADRACDPCIAWAALQPHPSEG